MDRLDTMIDEALHAEDATLLAELTEPGFFRQAMGLFGGPTGWVTWVLLAVQTVMFLAAILAGWRFYAATEALLALKWGLSAAVLAIMALQLKLALMPQMQADRVLRALRRLELRLIAARQ